MHMASNQYFLELEPPAERLRHAPHVVIVGGSFAGVHASAVADLHGFKFPDAWACCCGPTFTWP